MLQPIRTNSDTALDDLAEAQTTKESCMLTADANRVKSSALPETVKS